jgi:hypothetical protein
LRFLQGWKPQEIPHPKRRDSPDADEIDEIDGHP